MGESYGDGGYSGSGGGIDLPWDFLPCLQGKGRYSWDFSERGGVRACPQEFKPVFLCGSAGACILYAG